MNENYQEAPDTSFLSTITKWFRTGFAEISCTSKVGHIRLAISGLKNEKNKAAQEMGLKICSLLEKGELKIPEVEDLFLELRQIEKTIKIREAEIEQVIKDKEVRLLEVSDDEASSSWAAEPPNVKLAPSESTQEKPKAEKAEVKVAPRKRTAVNRAGTKVTSRSPRTPRSSTTAKKTDVTRKTATQRKITKGSKPRFSPKTRGSG